MEQAKHRVERFRPLRDQVLVQPESWKDRRTSSGLYMPANAKENGIRARVLAVGPGKILESGAIVPVPVAVGDLVLVCEYNAMRSTGSQCVGDNTVPPQLVHADDIRAVIEVEEIAVAVEGGADAAAA